LEYLPPATFRKMPAYTGVSAFLNRFEDPATSEAPTEEPIEILTPAEIRLKKRKRAAEDHEEEVAKKFKLWEPRENPKATEEAYNTLFVSRLNYKTTAETLRREFEMIAPVKAVRLVLDLEGKSRGYAFIEMEDEGATKLAYSRMKGRTIDDAAILVDVERGRTVKEWRPRRLGNLNQTPRVNKPKKSVIRQQEAAAALERRERGRGPPPQRDDRRGGYGSSSRGGFDRDRGDRGDRGGDRDRYRGSERDRPSSSYERDRGHDRRPDRDGDRYR
jgi:U1 small nuclear ribonucleoprotein